MRVEFITDMSDERSGFIAKYESIRTSVDDFDIRGDEDNGTRRNGKVLDAATILYTQRALTCEANTLHTLTCTATHAPISTPTHTCTPIHTHTCTPIHMHVHPYITYMYTHTHRCTQIHINVHPYT